MYHVHLLISKQVLEQYCMKVTTAHGKTTTLKHQYEKTTPYILNLQNNL